MTNDNAHEQDEVDRLLADDPRAHIQEGGDTQVWLLTGKDQLKAARELVATQQKQSQ